MSYEGFSEFLLKDGSYRTQDAYFPFDKEAQPDVEWIHEVDVTNGYALENDKRFRTQSAPKIKIGEMDHWKIDKYGNKYCIGEPLFAPDPAYPNVWRKV